MKRFLSFLINLCLVLISTGAVLILAELSFRKVIFSDLPQAESLREPGAYSDIYEDPHAPVFSEEYWVLYYLFDKFFKPPEHPHPLLGWIGYFDADTYIHRDYHKIQGRRPVLLFGDSFSMCVGAKCFEELLNEDSLFASKYYLLNYGVGGYGVDQIYLLARKAIPLYENPIVIFGLMTRDLDRNILQFRTGQKPYFDVLDGDLQLKGVPVEDDVNHFVEHHMPDINSYIYRYLRNSLRNYVPKEHEESRQIFQRIEQLNDAILHHAHSYLRDAVQDYRFLVFSALYQGEYEWRNLIVRDKLESENAPYIWAKDLIVRDTNYRDVPTGFYEDGTNGHPTSYQNQLICDEIKRCLFDSTHAATIDSSNSAYHLATRNTYNRDHLAHYISRIRNDKRWMEKIQEKAAERNLSIDSMVAIDAGYLLEEYRSGKPN